MAEQAVHAQQHRSAPHGTHQLRPEELQLEEEGSPGGGPGAAPPTAAAAWPAGLAWAGGQAAAAARPGVCTEQLLGSELSCLAAQGVRHCTWAAAAAAVAARMLPPAVCPAGAAAAACRRCDCSWEAPATSSSAFHAVPGVPVALRQPPEATVCRREPWAAARRRRRRAIGWAGSTGAGAGGGLHCVASAHMCAAWG